METFAKRVAERRKDLGLTQGKLGELSGLNQSDISKIERGKILETPRILALAEALRCSPYWLETGIGEANDKAFPSLVKAIQGQEEWPFDLVDKEAYLALPAASRYLAQVRMMDAIKEETLRLSKQEAPEKASRAA